MILLVDKTSPESLSLSKLKKTKEIQESTITDFHERQIEEIRVLPDKSRFRFPQISREEEETTTTRKHTIDLN